MKTAESQYRVRTDCRLCGGKTLSKVLDLGETPLANELLDDPDASERQDRFPLFLVQCADCYHVQLPVVVDPSRLRDPPRPAIGHGSLSLIHI